MDNFGYVLAHSVDDVIQLLNKKEVKTKILSGGTDLLPQLRDGLVGADLIVDVKKIDELSEIRFEKETGLYIGAAVSCLSISNHPSVRKNYPGLVDATSLIGGVQIQGRASVGGNLCNASPAADTIPALMVHGAKCIVATREGKKRIPVEDFCTAPGQTVLGKGEFLVGITMDTPKPGFGASYQRFIPRNEMDIAVVGVGVSLLLDKTTDRISTAKIALGAVAPKPVLAKNAAKALQGIDINDQSLEIKIQQVAELAVHASSPISDMRGSADQRKHLVKVLTKREISHAIQRAKQSLEVS